MDTNIVCVVNCLNGVSLTAVWGTILTVQACSLILAMFFPRGYRGITPLMFIYLATLVLGSVLFRFGGVDWSDSLVAANLLAQSQICVHQFYRKMRKLKK